MNGAQLKDFYYDFYIEMCGYASMGFSFTSLVGYNHVIIFEMGTPKMLNKTPLML